MLRKYVANEHTLDFIVYIYIIIVVIKYVIKMYCNKELLKTLILISRINANTKILTAEPKIYRGVGLCFIRYKGHLVDKYGLDVPTGQIETHELLLLICIKLLYHNMVCNIISFAHTLNTI